MANKLLLIALLFMVGCAGTPPTNTDYDAIKARASGSSGAEVQSSDNHYSEARYIVGYGISGTSQREADLNAKAQIAEQIHSSINSETTAFAKAVIRNGSSVDSEVLTSQVTASAQFSRAEMIKIDPDSRRSKKGQFYCTAYLSRRELSEILIAEYEDAAIAFRNHDNPDLATDLAAFTSSWKQANRSYTQMAASACEIQAVIRGAYQPFVNDRALMLKFNQQRLTWLSNIHVAVRIRNGGGIDTHAMAEAVSGAITELGMVADGRNCSSGLMLDLNPSVVMKVFFGTDVCEVTLSGSLTDCRTGNVLTEVSIDGLTGEGKDPISRMHKRATPKKIAPMLGTSLGHVLPVN
jgi:hypothetical protein